MLLAAGKDAAGHGELERELAALHLPAFMVESIRLLRDRREEADYGDRAPGNRWHEISEDSLRRAGVFLAAAAMQVEKYLA